jgi:HlyD family secretion protein
VKNPDLALLPGMTANLQVLTEARVDVLRVPNAALRFRPISARGPARTDATQSLPSAGALSEGDSATDALVYTLDQTGEPQPIRIRAGITDGSFTEILSGQLREGAAVITGNAPRVGSPSEPGAGRSGTRPRAPRLF